MVQKYDCQEPGSAPEPTLGNRVWTTFTFYRIATRPWVTCAKKITDDRARSSGYACSRTEKQARSVAYRNTPLACRDRSNNVSLNRCRPRRNTSSCRMSEALASALTQARTGTIDAIRSKTADCGKRADIVASDHPRCIQSVRTVLCCSACLLICECVLL